MSKQAKKIDLKQLYKLVSEKGAVTKSELAHSSKISVTAISDYINQLESLGTLIVEEGESSGGRRPLVYQINPEYRYVVGVDLQPSHCYLFISNLHGTVLYSQVVELACFSFPFYLATLAQAISAALEHLGLPPQRIIAVGISISGVTDFQHRMVDRSNALNWDNVPLAESLEDLIGIPVFVDTEVRIFARNEIELCEPNNIATVLYISQGIGLSLVINNEVLQGFTNRTGDNRFFGRELERLYYVLRNDPVIREINNQPYYSQAVDKKQIRHLNERFASHLSVPEVRQQMGEFTLHIANLMLAMTRILNAKKVLLTGNVFDYNDFIYHEVRQHMLAEKDIYYTPEIKRNKPGTGSLERGIVKFVLEKFFALDQFTVQEMNDAKANRS